MNNKIFLCVVTSVGMLTHIAAHASSAAPIAESDVKQRVAAKILPNPAITQAVADAIPPMPQVLAQLVSTYARYATFIIRNNLPLNWVVAPSDTTIEIRYGGALRARLLPGQSIDIAADPHFQGSIVHAPGDKYVEVELTYPGHKDAVTSQVDRKTYTEQLLNAGREYVVVLAGGVLPMLYALHEGPLPAFVQDTH